MANFLIPYTTEGNYTFNSDKIEMDSGLAKLKKLSSDDETFYASYNTDINGSRGNGVLTGTSHNGASVSNGKLDLTGGTKQFVTYDAIDNADMQQQGCIRFKFTPNYITPSGESVPFVITKQYNSTNNLIYYRDTSSHHRLHIYNSSGSLIVECYFNYKQWVAGQEYELEFNFDITNGDCRMFIDGVQQGSTVTGIGTRDSDINVLQLGTNYKESTYANFKIDDFQIFSTVQHTANYTPVAISETEYADDSPTIYKTLGDSIVNIETWVNFLEILGGANSGLVRYQLSEDTITWKYWDNSNWVTAGVSDYNTVSEINVNIPSFPALADKIYVRAFLISDGSQKVELDLNEIGYIINTSPTLYAGTDKNAIYNVAMTPFSDSTFSDAEGNINKAKWKEEGGVYAEISQGAYSTLLEAVQAFEYTPTYSGNKTLYLKVTDTYDASTEDTMIVNVNQLNVTVNVKDSSGNDLPDVTFDAGDSSESSTQSSPFSFTYDIGIWSATVSKTHFDSSTQSNTISISTTEVDFTMSRETRIDELICNIDASSRFILGDTFILDGKIDINLTSYKIRCQIYDKDGNEVQLATSNSGGSDSQIEIFNASTGEFIITCAKDLTDDFKNNITIEIEIENSSGQVRTIFKEDFYFEDEDLSWTSPTS